MELRQLLTPGNTYHICTRSNGDELLFRDHEDYNYFKESFRKRLSTAWEILAWTLIPTEMHLVVRVKDDASTVPISHSHLLGHVLNGYVQHYNRRHFRQGSLLNRSFRRNLIKTEEQLKEIICQVDNLAVAQEVATDKASWKHCSYYEFFKSNFITEAAQEVVKKFGDTIAYIAAHLKDEMIRANILPPRRWINLWVLRNERRGNIVTKSEPPHG